MVGTGGGGRPGICPTLLYTDAKAAIRQLTEGLGFTELSVYETADGAVLHAELAQAGGVVMVGSRGRGGPWTRPWSTRAPPGCTSWWTTWTPTTSGPWRTAWRS